MLGAALRQLGRQGVSALVSGCVAHAQELARRLGAFAGLSILNRVVFNQVVVRAVPPAGVAAEEFTRRLVVAIQREGTCYTTPTVWRGAPALRFAISNAATTTADIQAAAEAVQRVYAALLAS